MPKGPNGQKRKADVIGNAVHVMRIATGEASETLSTKTANKDAADKVWAAIQAKEQNGTVPVEIPVTVLSATANTFEAAITDANIAAKNADIRVVMAQQLIPQPAPLPGTTVHVVGVITSYSTRPFLFTMTHGRL